MRVRLTAGLILLRIAGFGFTGWGPGCAPSLTGQTCDLVLTQDATVVADIFPFPIVS